MPGYRFPKRAVVYQSVCQAVARLPSAARRASCGLSPCPAPWRPNAATLTGVSVRAGAAGRGAGTPWLVFGAGCVPLRTSAAARRRQGLADAHAAPPLLCRPAHSYRTAQSDRTAHCPDCAVQPVMTTSLPVWPRRNHQPGGPCSSRRRVSPGRQSRELPGRLLPRLSYRRGITGRILGRVIAMSETPSRNRASTRAGRGATVRQYDPELAQPDAQAGGAASSPGPAVTADDVARQMIAAMRRGDQPGAEQALGSYLARIPPHAGAPASDLDAAATALRDLTMKIAEVAAEEPV